MSASDELLAEMLAAGVIGEECRVAGRSAVRLVITDPDIAACFGMVDESDYWDEESVAIDLPS
ncbi:hypothetical protein [Planctellipticum variicoloris]|uniref:hypothetical protein n=1 Tax=Planctellipticum variicoloris TaxID=3064265 RepID=UPI0030137948|nr:hypothetical protein SH412_004155 [Planctomycetaceae bacterium SH412]